MNNIQGIKLDVLQVIAEIQEVTGVEPIEDMQIAEEVDLDITIVRRSLDALAKAELVKLEKVETLSGTAYNASLTQRGEVALAESRGMVQERLARL